MKKIYKKYNGVGIKDDGTETSREFKKFAREFKKELANDLGERGIELVEFHQGHYYFYGTAGKDGRYVYFSYYVPRGKTPINFDTEDDAIFGILVRKTESPKDFTGGVNHFCSLLEMVDKIEKLL